MITFICLFFPAVLSVFAYESLRRENLHIKKWIYLYVTDVLFINFACFFLKTVVLGTGGYPIFDLYNDLQPSSAMNYLIMAVPLAMVLSVVEALLARSLKFTVEDEDHEAKQK